LAGKWVAELLHIAMYVRVLYVISRVTEVLKAVFNQSQKQISGRDAISERTLRGIAKASRHFLHFAHRKGRVHICETIDYPTASFLQVEITVGFAGAPHTWE
jgi:hypothetical protein